MIPAAIQAPQAVAETINSFCPPGLSVAPVGTTITLYRGASKTPFASFAYTGPDSVLGIVVATWRIALADHGQPVTNITNVTTATAEEMKGLADALDILGWNRACEPTSWVRSYLNIEQIKLSEAREATEVAERRAAQIANDAMPAGYKLVSYHHVTEAGATTIYHWVTPTEEGPQSAAPAEALRGAWEQVATGDRERALGFLDALCVLGYHPDMNLDEWTEARMKQRDGRTVRFVDAADKVVLAGEVLRYEAKHLGDRLEWEAEVLHEVDVPGLMRDMSADAKATRVTDEQRQSACFIVGDKVLAGPRWTGITWMSAKGRAKTCRIEGIHVHGRVVAAPDAEGKCGPDQMAIKVPTSPWNLPAKLVRRIHGKKTLSFHVGGGKVITGTVAKVDASAISSMLLYVAT